MADGEGSARRPDRYYRAVLDAMPVPVCVVDGDVRVVDYNAAAATLVGTDRGQVLHRRSGEALHCLHATDAPEGCGGGPVCADCVIRAAVLGAVAGEPVSRRRMRAELRGAIGVTELDLLVTAAPFRYEDRDLALLILEDVSELIQLRGIIPICAQCKKVRDDREYWSHVEQYFSRHLGVDFSHGLCPDCARRLYPELTAGERDG